MHVHIRWCVRRDMEAIMAIEQVSFPDPFTKREFEQVLALRNTICMVAERGEKIVGYMVYELEKTRLMLRSIAVHPEHRRQGVGTQLIRKLVSKLSAIRYRRILVEVPERLLDTQLFLRANGFKAVKVLRGEDTEYLMERRVTDKAKV